MSLKQFSQVRVICLAWQGYSLEFQCPRIWTFNQIKCYIAYISPKIQFHLFQISYAGRILPGGMHLQQLLANKPNEEKTVLFLTMRNSQKFQTYYAQRMKGFFGAVKQEMDQMQKNSEETFPILNDHVDQMLKLINQNGKKEEVPNAQQIQANVPEQEPPQPANDNFGFVIEIIFIGMVLWTSWKEGSYNQIAIVVILIMVHYFLSSRRRPVNRRNNEVPVRRLTPQAKIFRKLYFHARQFLYCYIMSLFPNWNLDRDYLQQYKDEIEQFRREVMQVVPQPRQQQPYDIKIE